MVIALTIFFFITWGWLTYWVMVRPLILDSVEAEVSRLRFSVEWAFIQDDPGAGSEAAQMLLNSLKFGKFVRFVSFGQAVLMQHYHHSEIKALAAKERMVFAAAPLWIREAWQRHRMVSVKAPLANRPVWWSPLAVLLLAGVFSQKAKDLWDAAETATANKLTAECPV